MRASADRSSPIHFCFQNSPQFLALNLIFELRKTTISAAAAPPSISVRGVRKSARQRKIAHYPIMEQDLFEYLPSEITLNILLRLPIRTTMRCKCICKPWLNLLTTPEFVKSHLSKSVPGLAAFDWKTQSKPYKIIEFVDEEVDDLNCDKHSWNTIFNFDLPFYEPPRSSCNGLLCLHKRRFHAGDNFIICNPITRDYISLPPPPPRSSSKVLRRNEIYGFGVSRMSGQYKVVRVFLELNLQLPPQFQCIQLECRVYTVGTGSWRRIDSGTPRSHAENDVGAFLYGNLHWLAMASNGSSLRIPCLDLETELFSTFSPPPHDDAANKCRRLSVLGDFLWFCNYSVDYRQTSTYEIDIWLMKDYVGKSWTKDFVIRNVDIGVSLGQLYPIKVFKDGDILMDMGLGCGKLLYYSGKTKTIREADDVFRLKSNSYGCTSIFTPSFISLKTFAMENVSSF